MDYQKELMEIQNIRKNENLRKVIMVNDSEELKRAVFRLIKSELRNYKRAVRTGTFNITIEVTEDNRLAYALGKSEDKPDTWDYFGTGSSKVILQKEVLYEICKNINDICKKENITGISAHIENVFESLEISID